MFRSKVIPPIRRNEITAISDSRMESFDNHAVQARSSRQVTSTGGHGTGGVPYSWKGDGVSQWCRNQRRFEYTGL